jgi:hypothetical protein
MGTNSYRLLFRLDGQDLISSHIIRLEEWLHVAMVYDGVDKRIYVNGVLDAAAPQAKSDPIDASSRRVHLGMRESEGRHFDGVIDEVQIFNRALSAGEVATMHGLVVPPAPEPGLSFTDITVSAGVSDLADGGHGVMFAEVYGPAGQDSLPDLYLTNRGPGSADARAEQFYVNQGGWTFDEDAAGYFIDDVDGGSQGAVWADLDNDGDYDLVNGTTWDSGGNPDNNNVFENDGLGSFTDETPASISSVETKTHGLTAFDMDADGDLDLFSVSGRLDPFVHEAYLNGLIGGSGSFAFTTHVGGSLSTAAAMQGVVDTDYDGDGDIDIMAGNRSGDIAILENDGTGIFTQISPASLGIMNEVADGITTADVDNDGDLDLLLVRNGNASLYHRDGGNYVKQQTFTRIEGYMGGFADLDNDGYQDLIFAGDERTFMNDGAGTFVSGQSVPVSEIDDPHAIAFADIDSDGDPDFAISAQGSRNWLVRNDIDLAAGNWLRVELVSPQCQAGAFGAKVSVSRIPGDGGAFVGMREAKGNHGFLAQDEPVLHFGLGAIASVDVVVDFVDGSQTTKPAVNANQRILIDACNP